MVTLQKFKNVMNLFECHALDATKRQKTKTRSSLGHFTSLQPIDKQTSSSKRISIMNNPHDHHHDPPLAAENENGGPDNNILDDDDNRDSDDTRGAGRTRSQDVICSQARAQEIVRERHQVDVSSNNEDMDPIEWTVRKLVPIPAVYYWDVSIALESSEDKDDTVDSNDPMTREPTAKTPPAAPASQLQQYQPMSADMVPWKIRLWHESIYSLCVAGDFITRRIAQPIAGVLGLTSQSSSPFSYVFDNMTRQEWEASQQRAREQCRKNQQRRQQQQGEQAQKTQAEQKAQAPAQKECQEDTI